MKSPTEIAQEAYNRGLEKGREDERAAIETFLENSKSDGTEELIDLIIHDLCNLLHREAPCR